MFSPAQGEREGRGRGRGGGGEGEGEGEWEGEGEGSGGEDGLCDYTCVQVHVICQHQLRGMGKEDGGRKTHRYDTVHMAAC